MISPLAEFAPVAGDEHREYESALHSVAMFDYSRAGKLEITGKDAPSFLHNLCTNSINEMPLGAGCEAYFCDHKAKVLAHTFIYHILLQGKHAFWLEVTPGYHQKILQHLDRHLISEAVELSDLTERFAQIHIAGPLAKQTLEKAISDLLPELEEFQHMERTIGNSTVVHIRRHDPLGVPGYDLVCLNEKAAGVWKVLAELGATPSGEKTYEIMRVEACTPIYGIDINEDRFVMEVSRALRAVSYSKGCYLGQEPIVMARDRAGFVNRALMGVKIIDGGPIATGTKLYRDGNEVGMLTSSVVSPRLGPIAIGYIKRGNQDLGLKLIAKSENGENTVEVLGFPLIK